MKSGLLALLVIWGCQAPKGSPELVLKLAFPASIARNQIEYDRLLRRVTQFELLVHQEQGEVQRFSFAKGEKFHINPKLETHGMVEFIVNVWDRTENGLPRDRPVLSGKRIIGAKTLSTNREIELKLRWMLTSF